MALDPKIPKELRDMIYNRDYVGIRAWRARNRSTSGRTAVAERPTTTTTNPTPQRIDGQRRAAGERDEDD